MNTETVSKPRRRTASKPANRQASTKTKVTYYISDEAVKRLGVHSTMMATDRSQLIERLILDNLKQFKVSSWGGRSEEGSTVEVSES